MSDLYALLRISETASAEEILAMRRQLLVERHRADVLAVGHRLREAQRAIDILSDPERRAAYDAERRRSARREGEGRLLIGAIHEAAVHAERIGQAAVATNRDAVDRLTALHDDAAAREVTRARRGALLIAATRAFLILGVATLVFWLGRS